MTIVDQCRSLELDALQLEEDDEAASYLADINKVPDFVDEAPVEEVRLTHAPFSRDLNSLCSQAAPEKPEAMKTAAYSGS